MAVTPQKVQKKLLIRQGDNWFNLAQRYGVSPSELAKANGDIKKLLPGQSIVIPTASAALKALATKRAPATQPVSQQPPAGIPSDVWRRMQQDPSYQGMGAMARPKPGTNILGTQPMQQPKLPNVPSLQYGQPPAGIPSDVWRQMQENPQLGMQQIAQPNAATLFGNNKPAQPATAPFTPNWNVANTYMAQANAAPPTPNWSVANTYMATQPATHIPPGTPPGTVINPTEATTAARQAAAERVKANIAAAKAKPGAFQITEQERVAKEWQILNPGQPVPVFSQSFLQRLANADNAADYQRILQNWSASAGGVGAKNLVEILNKAYNDPTYPWPKAIMPYEVAKYNIDKSILEQLYVYDPKLGYYVIRTNVQGAPDTSGAGTGSGGGGGGGLTQPAQGFTGSGGMPGRQGGAWNGNQNNQSGMLGLINWRF